MERYLKETPMLDFSAPSIRALIRERGWDAPGRGYACAAADGSFEKIRSIYDFVRDEILFGYNTDDSIPASKVLRDGYGQCNTCLLYTSLPVTGQQNPDTCSADSLCRFSHILVFFI